MPGHYLFFLCIFLFLCGANAVQLVSNGAFTGGTGWTTQNSGTGADTTVIFSFTGTTALTGSSGGPSAVVLFHDITIPSGVTAASFSISIPTGTGTTGLTPGTVTIIDTSTGGDAFRVDLVSATGSVFTNPILFTLTAPTTITSPLTLSSAGLVSFLAANPGTLRLRIARVESTFPFNFEVDDVSLDLTAAVASPTRSRTPTRTVSPSSSVSASVSLPNSPSAPPAGTPATSSSASPSLTDSCTATSELDRQCSRIDDSDTCAAERCCVWLHRTRERGRGPNCAFNCKV